MTGLSEVDGDTLEGVSATTLWTLHNRGSEAKRSDGVIRDPWAVTPFGLTADEGLALAESIPRVRTARDVGYPPGRGMWKTWAAPPLDWMGFMRRIRPSMTPLEFGS
jgi:O-methyltransferase involved in polyketide biosynthesis